MIEGQVKELDKVGETVVDGEKHIDRVDDCDAELVSSTLRELMQTKEGHGEVVEGSEQSLWATQVVLEWDAPRERTGTDDTILSSHIDDDHEQEDILVLFEGFLNTVKKPLILFSKPKPHRLVLTIHKSVLIQQFEGSDWVNIMDSKNLIGCTKPQATELALWARDGKHVKRFGNTEQDTFSWYANIVAHISPRMERPGTFLKNINVWNVDDFGIGDIVLFKTNFVGSTVQRAITFSYWDHTGVVIPYSWGLTHVFPSKVEEKWGLLEATPDGVICCPLSARINQYHEDSQAIVSVRQLRNKKTLDRVKLKDHPSKLYQFVVCCSGQPYSLSKMLKTPIQPKNYRFSLDEEQTKSFEGYFCSDLCAIALATLDVMDTNLMLQPASYWPKSFTFGDLIDQHLTDEFFLTPELPVEFHEIEL